MRIRLPRAALAAALVLFVAGCSTPGGALPTPTSTFTPDPTPVASPPDDYDPRCDAAYGVPTAAPERLLDVRPEGWPPTPSWISLCLIEGPSGLEEIGHFAFDPDKKYDDVLWYYEHAFTAGHHAYVPVPGADKVFSGVIGGVSYYIQRGEGVGRFFTHWATDGYYDYED